MSARESVLSYDAADFPHIIHDHGRAHEVCEALEKVLSEDGSVHGGANLFWRGGQLVKVISQKLPSKDGIARPDGALVVHPVSAAHLQEIAGWAAIHWRVDAKGELRRINCPRWTAEMYLARGHCPQLRPLESFLECPTVTPNGRLIDQPGYDSDTGLYLAFSRSGYSTPHAQPTREDAAAAARRLLALVDDFPFCEDYDRSAFLAGVLTSLVRRTLPAAPLFGVTAPCPGTGKTLIAESFALIATGRRACVLTLGSDDIETEKRLGGAFLAADQCIVVDNIERALKGEFICQVTTQKDIRLRPMGTSSMVTVSTSAFICATGNNLSVVGDLKRRVCLIRLDAGVERPEHRQFKHNHLDRIARLRGGLLRDALTIPLAYHAARCPHIAGSKPVGGFEEWDSLVRRPLLWLGFPDPMLASEGLREQDPELEAARTILAAWLDHFGDQRKTAAEVAAAADSAPALAEALQLVSSRDKLSGKTLAAWLRRNQNRVVDGLTVQQAGKNLSEKVNLWQVRNISSSIKAPQSGAPF